MKCTITPHVSNINEEYLWKLMNDKNVCNENDDFFHEILNYHVLFHRKSGYDPNEMLPIVLKKDK